MVYSLMEVRMVDRFIIHHSNLPVEAGVILSKLLSSHVSLRVLDVSSNRLGDAGIDDRCNGGDI